MINPRWLAELWDPDGPATPSSRRWSTFLAPAEGIFRSAVRARDLMIRGRLLRVRRAPIPVLSVGGLEVGGSGKTPLVAELLRLAHEAGIRTAVLSRGYGARSIGSRRGRLSVRRVPSRPTADDAWLYGDEPVWLAAHASRLGALGVWIAPRRLDAARVAAQVGAELAILDDGFQHRVLHRDRDVVTLRGSTPLANGHLLPRGPLREPPSALGRADVVVLADLAPERASEAAARLRRWTREGTPFLSWRGEAGWVSVAGAPPEPNEPVALVAGIANPDRLRAAVAQLGFPVAAERFFRDHHRFTRSDLRGLPGAAAHPQESGCLVTTQKDWPRLQPALAPGTRVILLQQHLRWNEPAAEFGWREWMTRLVGR